jgi:GT2 family glycosyltransferase
MNEGAKYATGDVLLFLHADARLPAGATSWIAEALSEPDVVGGAFLIWTVTEERRSWLAPLLHLADLRSRYTGLPYGDQALFVRADVFRQLGGFPELPILEDLEFSRRLRGVGRIRTVPASVSVSGRRFLAGPLYYAALMKLIPLLYRLGISPQALASVYGHPR